MSSWAESDKTQLIPSMQAAGTEEEMDIAARAEVEQLV
jgi:hypothetical protein